MRDLFDPRSFGPSRCALTQHRSAGPLRRLDPFDVRTFGPQPSDRQLSRCRRDWQRHARLLASFSWPQRLVIIIGEIAVACLALVREGAPAADAPQRYNHYRCCIEIRDAPAETLHASCRRRRHRGGQEGVSIPHVARPRRTALSDSPMTQIGGLARKVSG
jgi:hypothetical protein